MYDRRELLIGAGAVVVASTMPVMTTATMVPETVSQAQLNLHPFFGVQSLQEKNWFDILRVIYRRNDNSSPLNEMIASSYSSFSEENPRIEIELTRELPQQVFDNMAAAEDVFLALMMSASPVCVYDYEPPSYLPLAVLINRQANLIMMRTWRGVGNRVLIHPERMWLFDEPLTAFRAESGGEVYGWKLEGTLNHSMQVWSHKKMPLDRILVTYRGDGEMDGPAIVGDKDGAIHMHILNVHMHILTESAYRGNFWDYVRVIGLNIPEERA